MRKFIAAVGLFLLLNACSATTGNMKIGTSDAEIKTQMSKLNNKQAVRKEFGTPNLIFYKDNKEYYEYKYITGHGRYHWIIPIIGWMMSLFQDNFTYTETNLFISFDKQNNIDGWNVVKTGGTFN